MAWCVGTYHPNRQWGHVQYYPKECEILPHCLLDAKANDMAPPPDVVLRDDQLDAQEEGEEEEEEVAGTVRACGDSLVSSHEGVTRMFSMFVTDLCFQCL